MRFVAAALCLLLSNAVAAAAKPPTIATHKDDVVDRLHGVDVADPYRWLEDADSPEVKAWTEAQNGATRRALDRVPGRAREPSQASRPCIRRLSHGVSAASPIAPSSGTTTNTR